MPEIPKILGIPKGTLMEKPILTLEPGKTAIILRLEGGHLFRKKMGEMGIREGKTIRLVAIHPFHGPVVVEVDGRETTLGRRMAEHIIVGNPE
jgi:ferrous iron transport protein A